mmetsp:Transcript_3006/g.7529  ORF Transcript_3006/g.7529 Transcript_3006/m.7529 type:complete len:179 (-) Transcript_3006:165-701(-)
MAARSASLRCSARHNAPQPNRRQAGGPNRRQEVTRKLKDIQFGGPKGKVREGKTRAAMGKFRRGKGGVLPEFTKDSLAKTGGNTGTMVLNTSAMGSAVAMASDLRDLAMAKALPALTSAAIALLGLLQRCWHLLSRALRSVRGRIGLGQKNDDVTVIRTKTAPSWAFMLLLLLPPILL